MAHRYTTSPTIAVRPSEVGWTRVPGVPLTWLTDAGEHYTFMPGVGEFIIVSNENYRPPQGPSQATRAAQDRL